MSDERLRERFQALREVEAGRAPRFEHTLERAEASRAGSRSRWLLAPAAAVAVAATFWLVLARPTPRPQPAPFDPGSWAMPTDVLLDMPGAELLREMPAIGTGIDGPPPPLRTG